MGDREPQPDLPKIILVVPRQHVKKIKTRLEEHDLFDKTCGIRPLAIRDEVWSYVDGFDTRKQESLCIYSNATCSGDISDIADAKTCSEKDLARLLETIDWREVDGQIGILRRVEVPSGIRNGGGQQSDIHKSPLQNIFDRWIRRVEDDLITVEAATSALCDESRDRSKANFEYTIYSPMLLLKPNFLSSILREEADERLLDRLPGLYAMICQELKVTHIAVSGAIPGRLSSSCGPESADREPDEPNILRLPTRFTPLYGDFGPLNIMHIPTQLDFEEAFWCSTVQNSIFQTWAPRYTMFSRGNISEKARILSLSSLTEERLGCKPGKTSVVDLYAGIGYFAFSYAKAGVGKVLCWELNSWSLEGLRRGAIGNDCEVASIDGNVDNQMALRQVARGKEKFMAFHGTNQLAGLHMRTLRSLIPSVRHVNCGYLPSSKAVWKTAVSVLDPVSGGWIHAHENLAQREIESRRNEVVNIFSDLVLAVHGPEASQKFTVDCEHLQRVKSYSPGVIHCVFDIVITPTENSGSKRVSQGHMEGRR